MIAIKHREPILLIGNGKLAASIYMCLINTGYKVDFYSENPPEAIERLNLHISDLGVEEIIDVECKYLNELENIRTNPYKVAIIITAENLEEKKIYIEKAEKNIHRNTIVAINTESIALRAIQENAAYPSRIIGANWSEPAHTTYFLEVITNQSNSKELVEDFYHLSKSWHKDAYIINNDYGIRSRMMCAMIREAFYLVENGYVSTEDIDRACRNDAGFYLPFAGNFRYMDLMGTYMYGIVMKDLNPELCNSNHIADFFKEIVEQGGEGMGNNQGIYPYQNGDTQKWDEIFRTFSYQIQEIIQKYPLEDNKEEPNAKVLITSVHE
ncbi:MAG: 3-hydroxyacyl-CoA dehydrogenase NAD-binding domain-containing protein [Segetibacter sp.]